MIPRRYKTSDFAEIKRWYGKRSMKPTIDLIPMVGFIVPGIAAGFLLSTDTSCCILEPFIANSDAPGEQRELALMLILGDLVNYAKNAGYTKIFGFSTNTRMVDRVIEHGFEIVETGSITVCKDLTCLS
jgi:hypothetical protein